MDRKWLLGIGAAGLAVLVLAIVVVLGSGGGAGPADAARAFFAAIPSGGPQAAYAKTAPAFQSSTTPDAWAATAAQYNLAQYSSSTWNDTGKSGSSVTLNGVLNMKGGGVQPATVQLVKGANGWTVYALNLPAGGVSGAAGSTQATAGATAGANAQAAAPIAPSGATGQSDATTGQPGVVPPLPQAQPTSPAGYPPAGYSQQAGYPPAPGQGPTVTLIPTRISHDCGPKLLNLPGVQSIDVHCVDPMAAVPGTRGHCQAMINGGGQPVNVSVVVQSYDPASDDAELDCRLY